MTVPLDQYADKNAQAFHAITPVIPEIPDFVKTAKRDESVVASLPSCTFADAAHRRLPVHTRADTWQSFVYFTSQKAAGVIEGEQARDIQDRLDYHAKFWGIADECEKVAAAFDAHVKAASAPPFYALEADFDGKPFRKYPITNAASVKAAAERFYADRDQYPYPWRRATARNLLAKAAELDADLGEAAEVADYLQKAAGFGVSTPQLTVKHIAERVVRLGDMKRPSPMQKGLAKIALALETAKPSAQLMHKVAAAVDEVDRVSGLYRLYKTGLTRPEEFCFAFNAEKLAAVEEQVVMIDNHIYKRADLGRIPLATLQSLFGEEITDHISDDGLVVNSEKLATVAATLPRRDMSLLVDSVMAKMKIQPIA